MLVDEQQELGDLAQLSAHTRRAGSIEGHHGLPDKMLLRHGNLWSA